MLGLQVVEVDKDGSEKLSVVLPFGQVSREDGTLPMANMVSFIRDRYGIDSAAPIQLYRGFEGRRAVILDGNLSTLLLCLDGSRTVYFARL